MYIHVAHAFALQIVCGCIKQPRHCSDQEQKQPAPEQPRRQWPGGGESPGRNRENIHAACSLFEPIPYGQWTLQQAWRRRSSCALPSNRPYGERESGGRSTRPPVQCLKEAATTK